MPKTIDKKTGKLVEDKSKKTAKPDKAANDY